MRLFIPRIPRSSPGFGLTGVLFVPVSGPRWLLEPLILPEFLLVAGGLLAALSVGRELGPRQDCPGPRLPDSPLCVQEGVKEK